MRRSKILIQLKSEQAQIEAAQGDSTPDMRAKMYSNPDFIEGYLHGRRRGLEWVIALLEG